LPNNNILSSSYLVAISSYAKVEPKAHPARRGRL
jgi:hypothetical protein